MKNDAFLLATFYLHFETLYTEEEFSERVTPENLIHSEISITLPGGNVIKTKFADMLDSKLDEFYNNKEATKHGA